MFVARDFGAEEGGLSLYITEPDGKTVGLKGLRVPETPRGITACY
jgi:hypothetical protein